MALGNYVQAMELTCERKQYYVNQNINKIPKPSATSLFSTSILPYIGDGIGELCPGHGINRVKHSRVKQYHVKSIGIRKILSHRQHSIILFMDCSFSLTYGAKTLKESAVRTLKRAV